MKGIEFVIQEKNSKSQVLTIVSSPPIGVALRALTQFLVLVSGSPG